MNDDSKAKFALLSFIFYLATYLDGHLSKFLGFLDF